MFIETLLDGIQDGFVWMPFVLGVGLLYKNMKTIDIGIDGIAIVSIISFVVTWRSSSSIMLSLSASILCAVICYAFFYFFIHKLKINAIFAGIIFSFILYAISVLAIGEHLALSKQENSKFFTSLGKWLPYTSILLTVGVAVFYKTKLGLSIRTIGQNNNANVFKNKDLLLLLGFVTSGFLVGYGAFVYAVDQDGARSGGGFDFVVNSMSSFLLVDKLIDFFINFYKRRKTEDEIIRHHNIFAFMQSPFTKAVFGSILFQSLAAVIIQYTIFPILWKLFLGIALIAIVANPILKKNDWSLVVSKSNAIVIDNLSFSYQAGHEKKTVFHSLSARFDKGINIIRGENGVGKSTLLKLINNELPYDSGRVSIETSENRIFFLRQNAIESFAEEMSVYENIISLLPEVSNRHIISANKLIRIVENRTLGSNLDFDFVKNKSILFKQINQLSGGQIQKISYLVALLSNCDVILADEPSSGLDDHNVEILGALMFKLADEGRNIIVVSHDNRLFSWNSKQYIMEYNSLKKI